MLHACPSILSCSSTGLVGSEEVPIMVAALVALFQSFSFVECAGVLCLWECGSTTGEWRNESGI